MSVTQTIEVPASRRVTLEIPREIPMGQVILTFTPKAAAQERKCERIGFLKGKGCVPADFDTMGQKEIAALFEGDR
jgi:hypothetical protein